MVDQALIRRKNIVLGSLLAGFVLAVMGRTFYVMRPDMTEREISEIEQRHRERKKNKQEDKQ
jgi:hypothetical protein